MTFEEKKEKEKTSIKKILKGIRSFERRHNIKPNIVLLNEAARESLEEDFKNCSLEPSDLEITLIYSKDAIDKGKIRFLFG